MRLSVPTSTGRPRGLAGGKGVEQRHRVLAAVAGEVTVVAVDHRQARAQEPREIEDRNAGAERKGRVRVAQVVRLAERIDASRILRRLPLAPAEVAQIDVAAARRRKEQRVRRAWQTLERRAAASPSGFATPTDRRLHG